MLALFRKPIAWMVLAECVVLAALVAVAWQMVAGARTSSAVPSTVFAPPSAQPDGAAPSLPDLADRPPGESGSLPGLTVTIGFWRARLGDLNPEEPAFKGPEWGLVPPGRDA